MTARLASWMHWPPGVKKKPSSQATPHSTLTLWSYAPPRKSLSVWTQVARPLAGEGQAEKSAPSASCESQTASVQLHGAPMWI